MRYTVIALIIILSPAITFAQKSNLYTDIGISFSRFYPGISATYNYKFGRWFGLGIGAQGYDFYPTVTSPKDQFVPGAFVDARAYILPKKKNQLFAFVDLGWDFYRNSNKRIRDGATIYTVPENDGFYTGFGFGYFRKMTKRGWGPYTSLKMIMNNCKAETYNMLSNKQSAVIWGRGTLVFSFGFKF